MPCDGFGLVVVAERPVPEHLEEGVVVAVAADRFEVVMLAGNSEALLAIDHALRGWRAYAEEIILELDHSGVSEEQRRIALGNQRRRGDDGMAALGEEVQERLSNLVGSPAHRGCYLNPSGGAGAHRAPPTMNARAPNDKLRRRGRPRNGAARY